MHTVPSGRVAIPRDFYKIIVRVDNAGKMHGLAFLLVNGKKLPVPPSNQPLGILGKKITAAEADQYLTGRLTSIFAIGHLRGGFFLRVASGNQG